MIVELLKEKTQSCHSAIERNELLSLVVSSRLNLEIYFKILEKFYGFFYSLENKINRVPELHVFDEILKPRHKTHLIKKDFATLGWADGKIASIPTCGILPALNHPSQLFGVLYVTEGSTLGGQVIAKAIKNSIGVTGEHGGSFFNGYGAQTFTMWQDTRAHIEAYSAQNPAAHSMIFEAANETFACLGNWFNEGENFHE